MLLACLQVDIEVLEQIDELFDEIVACLHSACMEIGGAHWYSKDKNHNEKLSFEEIEGVMLD